MDVLPSKDGTGIVQAFRRVMVPAVECRIIPIAQHKEGVLERADALLDELKKAADKKATVVSRMTTFRLSETRECCLSI